MYPTRNDLPESARNKLVDLLNLPGLGDPQLAPDGHQVLYVLSAADWKANRTIGHIWRASTDGSGPPVHGDGLGNGDPVGQGAGRCATATACGTWAARRKQNSPAGRPRTRGTP